MVAQPRRTSNSENPLLSSVNAITEFSGAMIIRCPDSDVEGSTGTEPLTRRVLPSRTVIALAYLYGIGPSNAKVILAEAQVDPNKRAKDLTEKEISTITGIIQKSYKVEGDLRREVQINIKRLLDIRCYRGNRHMKNLPVRGQRSKTNARTRKGPRKSIGGLSKKPPAPK